MAQWAESPSPDGPVEVQLSVAVKSIQEINSKNGETTVILHFQYTWIDPRVAKACSKDPKFALPKNIWKPGLSVQNGIAELRVDPTFIENRQKGELHSLFYYCGKVANPMNLEDFPFDEDNIPFRLSGDRMSDGVTNAGTTDFILRCKDGPKFVYFQFDTHLPEFQVLGVSYVEYIGWGGLFSYITFGIHIRRKHWYYFFKVTVLMWLIVLLTLPTFLFEFHELEQRMALTATMFLATAATLYVVGQDLPKTEKLHKIDILLLGTLGVIFAAGSESICVFLLHKTDMGVAEQVEGIAQVALPLTYVLMNIVIFVWPAWRLWFAGTYPKRMRKERVFIPWKDIRKQDPWGASAGAKILTSGKENVMNAPMQVTGGGNSSQARHRKKMLVV
jgi:hypothetical protein